MSACSSSGSDPADSNPANGSNETNIIVGENDTTNPDNSTDATSTSDTTDTTSTADTTDTVATGDTTNTIDSTDSNNSTDNANPEQPVQANLVSSATLPTVGDDGLVSWRFDATPSGLEVIVQPFVEMPLASNGRPARWNDIAFSGERLFAVDEQDGRVYEITDRQVSLWFDISSAIQSHTGRTLNTEDAFHGGVRGIAFHPEFASNGKFYASLMEQRPDNTANHKYISDNSGIDADGVLVEWTADTTSYEIDASSYRELFRVGVPEYDHPIKQIAFNPNATAGNSDYGNLYIAHGDGSVASSIAGTGQENNALGKILRINPLQANGQNYTIPSDNPFIDDPSLPAEVFSYGHRNPHHLAFSVDGHLLSTEAGRDNIEEVNLIENGKNYGWSEREGSFVHLAVGNLVDGIAALPDNDALNGYVYPVVQFGHMGSRGSGFEGQSLGGGHVVENGSPLNGQFFYIDFPISGLLLHSDFNDILQANTTGNPDTLTSAKSYIATVKFDHDSNPDSAPLDNNLQQIVQSAPGYINVSDRVDVRIEQGPNGVLYMMSKRNNMIYLVTSSLPGGPGANEARP